MPVIFVVERFNRLNRNIFDSIIYLSESTEEQSEYFQAIKLGEESGTFGYRITESVTIDSTDPLYLAFLNKAHQEKLSNSIKEYGAENTGESYVATHSLFDASPLGLSNPESTVLFLQLKEKYLS